jgi:DNA-directed RNA polymerase specialized sigma24 family protein
MNGLKGLQNKGRISQDGGSIFSGFLIRQGCRAEILAARQVIVMAEQRDSPTRATLLARLYRSGTADEKAWREFVDLYGRQIYKWCRHWQLQDADAEEVTQQVLLQLLAKMKEFVYDPARSFRAWLKTVSHHAWCNLVVSRQHRLAGGADSRTWERLLAEPARDDLVQRLEHEFDRDGLALAAVVEGEVGILEELALLMTAGSDKLEKVRTPFFTATPVRSTVLVPVVSSKRVIVAFTL